MQLTVDIYAASQAFPKSETYGLTQQLRRAAVSIPSNIAEGSYRNTNKGFNHFLGISAGSAGEVFSQVEVARRLGYINHKCAEPLLEEADRIKRMIYGFQKSLRSQVP